MVKKLFKHEYLAYARVMSLVYIILLTIAVASRIIMLFESDTVAYSIISGFSVVTYCVSVLAALGFSYVMGVVRFYKNLFTSEGYLSFTLPVTATQHIGVKAVTAVSMNLLTWVTVLLSGCIVCAGEMLTEIWKALVYILDKLYELAGIQSVLIGGEAVLLLLVSSFASVLLYDTFISIGQLFRKNRILAAVGAYFVYYILTQIFSTVLTITFSLLASSGLFADIGSWIILHPYTSIHIAMWGMILLSAGFALIAFIVIRMVITKKLNLE